MGLRQRNLYLGCFFLQFFLIGLVCFRDTFAILSQGGTVFGKSLTGFWQSSERVTSAILGGQLVSSDPLRKGLDTYLNIAGIEAGYSFFAPNVPNNYKLVFEIHENDGHIQYALPQIGEPAIGLRFATLLDYIGETRYDALREVMLKMLAFPIWQEYPNAIRIRAVLGFVNLPTATEYARGKRESYQFLYAYDFSFQRLSPQLPLP